MQVRVNIAVNRRTSLRDAYKIVSNPDISEAMTRYQEMGNEHIMLYNPLMEDFGNRYDEDGAYICKKCLSDSDAELYIQFTVCTSSLNIYVELHVPKAYWIEFGLCTFEPLCSLYREGYIEITNQRN